MRHQLLIDKIDGKIVPNFTYIMCDWVNCPGMIDIWNNNVCEHKNNGNVDCKCMVDSIHCRECISCTECYFCFDCYRCIGIINGRGIRDYNFESNFGETFFELKEKIGEVSLRSADVVEMFDRNKIPIYCYDPYESEISLFASLPQAVCEPQIVKDLLALGLDEKLFPKEVMIIVKQNMKKSSTSIHEF